MPRTAMETFTPDFKIMLAGKDITADLTEDIIEVRYEDSIEGESDECRIECSNKNRRWFDEWYPDKGDTLQVALGYQDALIDYSECEIAEIAFRRYPDTVTVIGLSTGVKQDVRSRNSKAYEDKTLQEVIEEVASKNDYEVVGDIKAITLERITQYQETDVGFLLRLANTYGHTFKIVGNKLVFAEIDQLKKADAVRVIMYEEMLDFNLTDKIKDVYKEAQIRQQNNQKKQAETITAPAEIPEDGYQVKVLNISYGNREEGEAKAKAALDSANDEKTLGDIVVVGDPLLVAGNVVELTDIGKFSGHYLITKSSHFINSEGYKTGIDLKRILEKAEQ